MDRFGQASAYGLSVYVAPDGMSGCQAFQPAYDGRITHVPAVQNEVDFGENLIQIRVIVPVCIGENPDDRHICWRQP